MCFQYDSAIAERAILVDKDVPILSKAQTPLPKRLECEEKYMIKIRSFNGTIDQIKTTLCNFPSNYYSHL